MIIEDDEKDKSEKESNNPPDKDKQEEEDDSDESSEEEEKDSKEDDVEDGGDNDKDEGDLLKQYAKDPKSIDPKLRPAVKKLLGIHTRRMQEASRVIKKAQALDILATDPEFREWAEQRQKDKLKGTSRKRDDDDDEEDDEEKPLTRKDLLRFEENLSRKEKEKELRQTASQFKKDNPDWKLYEDRIGELLDEHPTLPYQMAYNMAVQEEDGEPSDKKKEELRSKKNANINKPSRSSGKGVQKKGKMTFQEALALAKEQLGWPKKK